MINKLKGSKENKRVRENGEIPKGREWKRGSRRKMG